MENIKEQFKKIKLLVCDFDGVMTDNKVLTFSDGTEGVFCNRSDGLGIEMLKRNGIETFVISLEKNPVVQARCKKLNIECWNGVAEKINLFRDEVKKRKIDMSDVCYIGNDVNDLDCIKEAGIGVAVADSHADVLDVADFVTTRNGGMGAVREISDLILGK